VDTFGADKESGCDEESPNGIGKRGGHEEEGGGIRLREVRVFGHGDKGKHEAASSGTVADTAPVHGRLHGWRVFHS